MKTFLEYVAEDIIRKYGTDLSRIAVVFPNKRASLFLNDYLARLAGKPLWSPTYTTISDLFRQHSPLNIADPIKLIADLHKSVVAKTGTSQTIDQFYGWGQVLLADFDDIDKNMADADAVFANVRDIHELDDVSYLNDDQKRVIQRFFSNFSDQHNSLLKERFLSLWSHISDIYHDFNRRLTAQGLAYEGALYRKVADTICSNTTDAQPADDAHADSTFPYDAYLFVGFNMVQRVEQQLFTYLKKQGKARFYWDFDDYYMTNNEAGHYISQYLADYPNELDRDDAAIYNVFSQRRTIHYVAAPTENIQARYAAQWLREDGCRRIDDGRQTAVVLCNEGLLQTVIHCLPDEVDKVNVTTGYPLAQTPIAALVNLLIELHVNGYDQRRQRFRQRQRNAVLRHPYISQMAEDIAYLLFTPLDTLPQTDSNRHVTQSEQLTEWLVGIIERVAKGVASADPLFQESAFRTYTLLNRLLGLMKSDDLQVDITTMQRLMTQLIQTTSIPFHGEPAEGLQVMGVLETRNLDFRHLLVLSCTEGNMPKGVNDTSLIPYNIRKAHGMTTIDNKVAIYSYYFHRMLQRAEDITIVFNNATTDNQRGEMSRFLLQLMVESPHHIVRHTLRAGQSFTPFNPQPIEKTATVMEKLMQRFSLTDVNRGKAPLLTPTAINRYMRCPLQFYYNYVCRLREPDITDEDVIDNRIFGNIFHEASRIVYSRLMQRSNTIRREDLERLLKEKVDIVRAVDEAFNTEFFKLSKGQSRDKQTELSGLQIINREVIIHYLRQLIEIDRQLAPFTIIALENDVKATLATDHLTTTIGGRIDRLDMINDEQGQHVRVIDYKTGAGMPRPLANVDAIFAQASLANHSDYYLQTFIYSVIVKNHHQDKPVSPALLFIQHAGKDNYSPVLKFGKDYITDVAPHADRFRALLKETVDEMFDASRPFVPTDDRERCRTCPYKDLCSLER